MNEELLEHPNNITSDHDDIENEELSPDRQKLLEELKDARTLEIQ
jgi:hypothetical protein